LLEEFLFSFYSLLVLFYSINKRKRIIMSIIFSFVDFYHNDPEFWNREINIKIDILRCILFFSFYYLTSMMVPINMRKLKGNFTLLFCFQVSWLLFKIMITFSLLSLGKKTFKSFVFFFHKKKVSWEYFSLCFLRKSYFESEYV